ncbi:hypothetical protein B0H13DRAFT_2061264 [Mycena leptocephala]|nr:hypothetical protein B0H13DRAFT_2061264 [Mycena leptocephala]
MSWKMVILVADMTIEYRELLRRRKLLRGYPVPFDPLVSHRARVEMVATEIWKLGGCHSVKDHKKLKGGHRTRFWCSQDEARKKKSKASQDPGIRNRDNVGMKRFPVQIKHAAKHVNYVDVSMPPEALDMIRENVEWLTRLPKYIALGWR